MARLVVATIAGSDPSGGAGLQTDLRVFTLLGAFGQTVITALTVQNSLGVKGWEAVSPEMVKSQLEALFEDLPPRAVKTGMLARAETIHAVAEVLEKHRPILVVDPVMVAKGGEPLLESEAVEAYRQRLLPLATVITPNLPEAEVLLGQKLSSPEEMARSLQALGPRAVVVKGGHAPGEEVRDVLFDGKEFHTFSQPRLEGRLGHGTGCTFAAALTVLLGKGLPLPEAVGQAQEFVYLGLLAAKEGPLGRGISPLDHLVHLDRLKARAEVPERLTEAVEYFCQFPVRKLIPEVQSNLGYALPLARNAGEVAAFPGRIVALGERAKPVGCPTFGASRHVANVILAAMRHDPQVRSAMNVRFAEEFLEKAQKKGLSLGEFSRAEEPPEIKAREGSTLSWGVDLVCRRLGFVPDLVVDRGDVGKEPMIRVLGRDPLEVVKKALKLLD
ncbi:MAG: bifunctional hydroxymethylpyrimidine kinase/phosphomethylpyrimidine kinase [Thermodesulfobacteria bacterium]|nr:bifunctional hydroxymethylpyrimidine kinase/phosphomethylpyrimidine kinase [Thermodesulfobacteriota bacterium]